MMLLSSATPISQNQKLFGEGVKRTAGEEARRHNLLAARLIAELVKGFLGPRGLEKMFIDIMGEVTVTKDGATLLRKIDVEHPAAKVLIEASNAVDNAVGDGTTSVVVFAGALIKKAEELLDLGVSPATISKGYLEGLDMSLEILKSVSKELENSDRQAMENLASTSLGTKAISCDADLEQQKENRIAKFVVDAVATIADFKNKRIDIDDIKIEEKPGNAPDTRLVKGVVIDKTIDSSNMPRIMQDAKILLISEDLEPKRTKAEAEISISMPDQIKLFVKSQSNDVLKKVQNIIESGANVIISSGGISLLARTSLARAGIISIRRVKENDLIWLEKATGARITRDLGRISSHDIGYAEKVYEKFVGDDKMVFVEGCKNPKAVTILLRANSKKILDEYHRSVLDAICVLKDFVVAPRIVSGGGSTEATLARKIRARAYKIEGREQIVMQKFADALEEIPLIIASNSGMDAINTLSQIRSGNANSVGAGITHNNNTNGEEVLQEIGRCYGIDAVERRVVDMRSRTTIVEPLAVKEQVINTAVEVVDLLLRVDDVLMAKPVHSHGHTHSHADGTVHSHNDGDKKHDHYFDMLGKKQRPRHHYY